MKTKNILIACLLFSTAFTACKKEGSAIVAVDNGKWRATQFSENGEDHVSQLAAWTFCFNNDNKAIATNGNRTITGVWTSGNQNGQMMFNLRFSEEPLNKLNKDWQVMDQCANSSMRLRHADEVMDYLTFAK